MKWGVGIIIANYLILYVFQLHIKYYRQMGSFYLVHTGKDRHQHWSSNDLQAVPLTTTHTTPNHILTLRSNPMPSPGVDENHHISHSGDTNLHCFRFGFLGAKIRGNLVQGESESPDDFPRRLFSSPCPRGAVESLALTPQAAPLCCLPEHSLYTITVTYCHLLASPVTWQSP